MPSGAVVPYGIRAPRRVAQRGDMAADIPLSDRLDDDDYPAYTMGRAAEMLGTTPGFLRAIGEARLITPCARRADTAGTPATNCGSPPAPASSSTGEPRSRLLAASSSSRTSSRKLSASTPRTAVPRTKRPTVPVPVRADHVRADHVDAGAPQAACSPPSAAVIPLAASSMSRPAVACPVSGDTTSRSHRPWPGASRQTVGGACG